MGEELSYIDLAAEAKRRTNFKGYRAVVELQVSDEDDAVSIKVVAGWKIGKITVHKNQLGLFQLSSINGRALSVSYRKQIAALRAAWVVSQFTDGVLDDAGNVIGASDRKGVNDFREVVSFCDNAFRQ